MEIKELTELERLELAFKYSISSIHKKSLLERINKLKNPVTEPKAKKAKSNQLNMFGEVEK